MFSSFQILVDAFSDIINSDSRKAEHVRLAASQPDLELNNILGRIEYEKIQKGLRDEQDMEDEEERGIAIHHHHRRRPHDTNTS